MPIILSLAVLALILGFYWFIASGLDDIARRDDDWGDDDGF